MYILTTNNDVIMYISETLSYNENGSAIINNGSLAVAQVFIKDIYQIDEIPTNIIPNEYCYNNEKGFYKNENYKPIFSAETEIIKIQEQITDLQLALVELVEGSEE